MCASLQSKVQRIWCQCTAWNSITPRLRPRMWWFGVQITCQCAPVRGEGVPLPPLPCTESLVPGMHQKCASHTVWSNIYTDTLQRVHSVPWKLIDQLELTVCLRIVCSCQCSYGVSTQNIGSAHLLVHLLFNESGQYVTYNTASVVIVVNKSSTPKVVCTNSLIQPIEASLHIVPLLHLAWWNNAPVAPGISWNRKRLVYWSSSWKHYKHLVMTLKPWGVGHKNNFVN